MIATLEAPVFDSGPDRADHAGPPALIHYLRAVGSFIPDDPTALSAVQKGHTHMSITVLYVPADGECAFRDIEPDLAAFQELVGGYIEAIRGPQWTAYLNEEGKVRNLPANRAATALAKQLGWNNRPGDVIVGPAVFCGPPGRGGADTSLSDHALGVIKANTGLLP